MHGTGPVIPITNINKKIHFTEYGIKQGRYELLQLLYTKNSRYAPMNISKMINKKKANINELELELSQLKNLRKKSISVNNAHR